MTGSFGDGPKFTGDLSHHLPPRSDEPPDRWIDRLRHAWLLYTILAVAVMLWVSLTVAAVINFGPAGLALGVLLLLPVVGTYMRVIQWRLLTGRDPVTGSPTPRRDR